jgi:hypothetical protein
MKTPQEIEGVKIVRCELLPAGTVWASADVYDEMKKNTAVANFRRKCAVCSHSSYTHEGDLGEGRCAMFTCECQGFKESK